MSAPDNFNIEHIKNELRTSYTSIGNIDLLFGAYRNANNSMMSVDNEGLDILENLHTDSLSWIASSVAALGTVMAFYDLDEMQKGERSALGALFSGLGELQTLLMDVGVVLDNTRAQHTKAAIAKAGSSKKGRDK